MTVIPMSDRTAIRIFMVSRTMYSVVVVKVASRWGCLIWTAINSKPPATAAAPAARVSAVVVMVMSLLDPPFAQRVPRLSQSHSDQPSYKTRTDHEPNLVLAVPGAWNSGLSSLKRLRSDLGVHGAYG